MRNATLRGVCGVRILLGTVFAISLSTAAYTTRRFAARFGRQSVARLAGALVLAATAAVFGLPAYAQVVEADPSAGNANPLRPVQDPNGNFTQAVPIQVPPFHGMEPT